mgnify:CR=1 FL=1
MGKVSKAKITDLVGDNLNFNKGTQYGDHLMDESLRQFGLGRSILIDKNNRIIAGNKTTEKSGELGFEDVLIVETDGKTLVAVKRTDIDLDSKAGRELALADNATAHANLEWDEEAIAQAAEAFNFDPVDWGVNIEGLGDTEEEESPKKEISTRLIVECKDVSKLSMLYSELQDRGFEVELKE